MKSFVAILALVAVAAADVSHLGKHPDADSVIVKHNADVFPDKYNYEYETSNGIYGQESGVVKNPGHENEAISVQGQSSYTAPDGQKIQVNYVADENGYHPQGAHLPTPPAPEPIPEYILRAIEYIAAHPPKADRL